MLKSLSLIQTILSAGAATSGLLLNGYIISVLIWQRRVLNDRNQNVSNTFLLLNLAIVDILFCLQILFASTPISFIINSSLIDEPLPPILLPLLSYTPDDSNQTAASLNQPLVNSIGFGGDSASSEKMLNALNPSFQVLKDSPLLLIPVHHSLTYLVSQLQGFLWTSLPISFVWTVTGITIDKYITISYPLHASRIITTKRVAIFITMSWLTGFFLSLPPLMGICTYAYSPYRSSNSIHCDRNSILSGNGNSYHYLLNTSVGEWIYLSFVIIYLLFSIIIPLLAITICNFHILLIAENHRHRIVTAIYEITLQTNANTASNLSMSSSSSSASSTPTAQTTPANTSASSQNVRSKSVESLIKRRGRDAFLPVSQLIGSLILFTVPSYVIFCLEALDGIAIHPVIISLVTFCLTLMPTINAYIYGVKSKLLRQTFKFLLHRYLYKQGVSLEIDRRLSLRSQCSQNSLYRYTRRNSCPILANTSSSSSTSSRSSRVDLWLSNGSPTLKAPLRRQSLCILDESSHNLSSSKGSLLFPVHRTVGPPRVDYLPPFKLFPADSIVKLSPIEEQTAGSDNV